GRALGFLGILEASQFGLGLILVGLGRLRVLQGRLVLLLLGLEGVDRLLQATRLAGSAVDRHAGIGGRAGHGLEFAIFLVQAFRRILLIAGEGFLLDLDAVLGGPVQALAGQPLRQDRRPAVIAGETAVGLLVLLDLADGLVEGRHQAFLAVIVGALALQF